MRVIGSILARKIHVKSGCDHDYELDDALISFEIFESSKYSFHYSFITTSMYYNITVFFLKKYFLYIYILPFKHYMAKSKSLVPTLQAPLS